MTTKKRVTVAQVRKQLELVDMELTAERAVTEELLKVNHVLQRQAAELKAKLERVRPEEPDDQAVLRALAREEPDSLIMAAVLRLIRESYRAACVAGQDPRVWTDPHVAAHHAGGAHYMDNLDVVLMNLWAKARKERYGK